MELKNAFSDLGVMLLSIMFNYDVFILEENIICTETVNMYNIYFNLVGDWENSYFVFILRVFNLKNYFLVIGKLLCVQYMKLVNKIIEFIAHPSLCKSIIRYIKFAMWLF